MTAEKTEKKPAAKKAAAKPAGKAPRKTVASRAKKTEKHEVAHEAKSDPVEQPKVLVTKSIGNQNFYAVGKRKTAVAQVIISSGDGKITVNELPVEKYFGTPELVNIVNQPLNAVGVNKAFTIRGKVHGGGIHAQAESMRHAITRAIVSFDPESRRTLKKLGFLTRDSRIKERKKPGLKRARRAPQFSKR